MNENHLLDLLERGSGELRELRRAMRANYEINKRVQAFCAELNDQSGLCDMVQPGKLSARGNWRQGNPNGERPATKGHRTDLCSVAS